MSKAANNTAIYFNVLTTCFVITILIYALSKNTQLEFNTSLLTASTNFATHEKNLTISRIVDQDDDRSVYLFDA